MRPFRLLVLLNSLAPYGAETFVLNHASFADRSAFELVVCKIGGSDALTERVRAAGVEVVDLGGRRRPSPVAAARLARLLRSRRIDVLQTHIGYAGILGRIVGRAVGVPVIVSTEQTVRSDYSEATRRLNDLTFRFAHAHVFLTRAVVRSFAEAHPFLLRSEQTVISNGVDTREIGRVAELARADARAALGLRADDFAFGNVARLAPTKGQRHAILALARVRQQVPHASLWIVGAGPLEDELRQLARAERVENAVHFLGQRLDVLRLLSAFDAYIHPSTTEALGVAVLEAMSAGLPTIVSAVDGLPELVQDGETGWHAPPRDDAALAGCMFRILRDRSAAREVGLRGRRAMERDHDIRISVSKYERLYLNQLAMRGRADVASAMRVEAR